MVSLTVKQHMILSTIVDCIASEGIAPTLGEIAAIHNCDKTTVWEHIRLLQQNGYVRRERGRAQCIRILHLPEAIASEQSEYARAVIATIPLTKKLLPILRFIIAYEREHRRSVSLQEIADEFAVDKVTILEHVRQLERRGCLRRTPYEPRSIEVLYHPPVATRRPGSGRNRDPRG